MSKQFKVGEIVIGCNCIIDVQYNGQECEILEGPREYFVTHQVIGERARHGYKVRWASGKVTFASPYNLRRRKPPTTGEQSILAMFKPTTKREGAPA